jgi:hypothetical protein
MQKKLKNKNKTLAKRRTYEKKIYRRKIKLTITTIII